MAAAIEVLGASEAGRPFIILLSDGGDTVSTRVLAEAAALLQDSGIGFYAVELATAESDHAALEALAGTTAGRVVAAADPSALAGVYAQIASELVNQLLISYSSLSGGLSEPGDHHHPRGPGGLRDGRDHPTRHRGHDHIDDICPATTTTSTSPAATTSTAASPPPSYRASGPGLLGSSWVKYAGAATLFLAALIIFSMGLLPAARSRGQLAGAARARFGEAGGALTRLADRAKEMAESALTRAGRRTTLGRALDSAGVRLAAGEFVILTLCAGLVGLALGAVLWRLPGALILGALGLFVPHLAVTHMRQKRQVAFAEQLDGTLQLLAGSLRAGYGLLQSVSTVSAEAASPTGEEFGRIMVETRLGRDLVDSLTALADRMASQDFRWVAQAIDIQRTVGGDLAEILDTVGQTIRERNQIRRQIRALSAEGRISSYILIAIPFFLAAFILVIAPDFLSPLWTTTPGRVAIAVGAILMVVGIIWIRRLVRLRF